MIIFVSLTASMCFNKEYLPLQETIIYSVGTTE